MSFSQNTPPQLSFIEASNSSEQDLLTELASCDDITEVLTMLLLDETLSSGFKYSIRKQLRTLKST